MSKVSAESGVNALAGRRQHEGDYRRPFGGGRKSALWPPIAGRRGGEKRKNVGVLGSRSNLVQRHLLLRRRWVLQT